VDHPGGPAGDRSGPASSAGIAWHVRPFFYLGTTFLLIAVLMMSWAARQDHWTWLWYVAVLAAGFALLTVLGLFENRHEHMVPAGR
jgi:hypothetical protein